MKPARIFFGGALVVLGLLVWSLISRRETDAPPSTSVAKVAESRAAEVSSATRAPDADAKAPVSTQPCTAKGDGWCGRVVDAATGKPIREFDITLREQPIYLHRDPPGDVIERRFKSADGRLAFVKLHSRTWWVQVRAQVFEIPELLARTGERGETLIPMRSGLALKGRVYDERTGIGMAGASIRFRESQEGLFEGNWRDRPATETRPDGAFALDGLPHDQLALLVSAEEYAPTDYWVQSGNKGFLEIALSAAGRIAGRVVRSDGSIPGNASVGLSSLDTASGISRQVRSDGSFEFANVAPGRYLLNAEVPDGRSWTREIPLRRGQHLDDVVL